MISNKAWAIGIVILGFWVALLLLLPLLLKFFCHPKLFLEEIKHPTVGSIIPTIAMTLMFLSHTLGLMNESLAIIVWCLAVVCHISFFTLFVYHRFRDFDLNHLVPSWFVPPIGIVVACLTVPAPFFLPLAHVLLGFGIVSYLILLPLVLYRISIGTKIEDARKPTLAILAAPGSLTLSGYLTIVTHPNPLLVLFLCSIAILMTVSVYLMLFHLLRLPFVPACTAFTFPLSISATAMYKMNFWIFSQSVLHNYATYFHIIALIEGVLTTLIIIYILGQMLRYLKITP